ncbi:Origin recognition complex subunit 5 [Ranunculus cassubicifolius]
MVGEESPQVSKRTTRSSAANTPSKNNNIQSQRKHDRRPPSLVDSLGYGDQLISQDTLISTFPGRRFLENRSATRFFFFFSFDLKQDTTDLMLIPNRIKSMTQMIQIDGDNRRCRNKPLQFAATRWNRCKPKN